MKIVLATRNRKKIEEMKRMFAGFKMHFLNLDSFPDCPDVEEDGKTFEENAVKKAVSISKNTGQAAIADDSGLEVQALEGAPGVFSARYSGENADDQGNVKKLLKEMTHLKDDRDRKARFVCCIAYAFPDGYYRVFTGYVNGRIGKKQKGSNGFGYDPVFYPSGHKRTFAEMTDAEKDSLSHRGRAINKLQAYFTEIS